MFITHPSRRKDNVYVKILIITHRSEFLRFIPEINYSAAIKLLIINLRNLAPPCV